MLATFQYLMKCVVYDSLNSFWTVYLNDILVYSGSRSEHLAYLFMVFVLTSFMSRSLNVPFA